MTEFTPHENISVPEGWNGEAITKLANTHQLPVEAVSNFIKAAPQPQEFTPHTHEALFKGVDIKPEATKDFLDFVNTQQFSADGAQAVLEFQNNLVKGYEEHTKSEIEAELKEWSNKSAQDELLNSGSGYEANINGISTVLEQFGGEATSEDSNEFLDMLQETGVIEHPAMLRFLFRISQKVAQEGRPVIGLRNTSSAKEVPLHDRLFGPEP